VHGKYMQRVHAHVNVAVHAAAAGRLRLWSPFEPLDMPVLEGRPGREGGEGAHGGRPAVTCYPWRRIKCCKVTAAVAGRLAGWLVQPAGWLGALQLDSNLCLTLT
jgi:hypothetical protein